MKTPTPQPPNTGQDPTRDQNIEQAGLALPGFAGEFYRYADRLATHYGIPAPALMLHGLAVASAMGRGFVSSAEAGPALLPLLVRCPETPPPDWMGDEWLKIQALDDLSRTPPILDHPQRRAAMRRQERIQTVIDPDRLLMPTLAATLKSLRLRFGHLAVTHGTRKLASGSGSLPLTHLCGSLGRVSAVLHRLGAGLPDESLIGCVDAREFQQLIRQHPPLLLVDRAGLVLPVPRMRTDGRDGDPPLLMTGLLFDTFLARRQKFPPFEFTPDSRTKEVLEVHTTVRQAEIRQLPEPIQALAPRQDRVWHMAALLASLSHPSFPDSIVAAVSLAMYLDNWATERHLYLIRFHCPADHQGWFEGTDLAVFRQLGERPQKLRDIQRRLRGVRKHQCLAALRRALDAGLAVELPGPFYQRAPDMTDDRPDLSETDAPKDAHPPHEATPRTQKSLTTLAKPPGFPVPAPEAPAPGPEAATNPDPQFSKCRELAIMQRARHESLKQFRRLLGI